jgi:single-strand DNA-binding protein
MAKFTLAVNRFGGGAAGAEAVDFIDIVAWRKLAEICGEFLKKGSLCLVEGRIQVRQYDTEGGRRKYATEVVARNMQFLEPKKGAGDGRGGSKGAGMGQESAPYATAGTGQLHGEPAVAAVDDDEIFEAPDDLPF